MNNQNSIRAYYDLRKSGASGGINCQKVLKSGGPEKANPFTLNACLGELKQQASNIQPNPQHDKQIEQITSKTNEQIIEQVKKDFATRENFKFKTEFLINDEQHIAFNQLVKKHDPNAKLNDFEIYQARNGKSEYWTLDMEYQDIDGNKIETYPSFRISDHWVESGGQFSKSSIETRNPKYYGTIQLDEKEPGAETSYETLLTLVPYRNGMISRDQLDLIIKATQERDWNTPDYLTDEIKEFNQKIMEQNKITISKQKEALAIRKEKDKYKNKTPKVIKIMKTNERINKIKTLDQYEKLKQQFSKDKEPKYEGKLKKDSYEYQWFEARRKLWQLGKKIDFYNIEFKSPEQRQQYRREAEQLFPNFDWSKIRKD